MTPRGAASPTPWTVDANDSDTIRDAHGIAVLGACINGRTRAHRAEITASAVASVNERAGLIAALRQIEALEKRADGVVGMVDDPHTRALRAACEIARRVLAQSDEPNKEGAK